MAPTRSLHLAFCLLVITVDL